MLLLVDALYFSSRVIHQQYLQLTLELLSPPLSVDMNSDQCAHTQNRLLDITLIRQVRLKLVQ